MANEISRLKAEIREADDNELERLLQTYRQEHFQLRMQAATSALENPKRIGFVRKAVARIETAKAERRITGEAQ
jgi:large subunit ribosomal protein L29